MTTHVAADDLVLLSQQAVAERIGRSVDYVRACRTATTTKGAVRPMDGWVRDGDRWAIPGWRLRAWIEALS